MRLESCTAKVIKQTVLKYDPSALVYLFGSRVDDSQKGGDIDIMIISSVLGLEEKISIEIDIERDLGKQDMDLVIKKSPDEDAFTRLVLKKGIVRL